MRGTAFNPGQMAELNTAMSIAVTTAMQKVASKFGDPKAVLKGIKDNNEVLSARLEPVLVQVIRSMLVLVRRGSATLATRMRHVPNLYYRNGPRLDVSEDFFLKIASQAGVTDVSTVLRVDIDDLSEDLLESVIEKALPKKHNFEVGAVCALIAELIAMQPNGEAGYLERTGKANVFFTNSGVACVNWDAAACKWKVQAWSRAESIWNAGGRVFYPAR